MESFMPTKLRAVLEKFRIFGKCLTPRCVTQFSTKTRKNVTRVSVSLRYSVTTTEKLDSALCLPAQIPTSRCKVQCRLLRLILRRYYLPNHFSLLIWGLGEFDS